MPNWPNFPTLYLMRGSRTHAYILLIISVVIWGAGGPIIKTLLSAGLEPLIFLLYRFLISGIIGVFLLKYKKFKLPRSIYAWVFTLLYSILATAVSLVLLFSGLKLTTVLDMTIIVAISPLITSLAGNVFLNEKITGREKFGMGIAFAGTALSVAGPVLSSGYISGSFFGNLLILASTLVNAIAFVLAKKAIKLKVNPSTLSNLSFIIGFVVILPAVTFAYGIENITSQISHTMPQFHLGVWYMAIFGGNIAFTLYNKAQKAIEIGEASVFKYLDPLVAAPLAVFWLGEKIDIYFLFGAALILVGVIFAETKSEKARPQPHPSVHHPHRR